MEVRTEKLVIEAGGSITMAAGSLLGISSYATADIPAAAAGNEGCIVYDTTLNKLYFSTGAAWEAVTSA